MARYWLFCAESAVTHQPTNRHHRMKIYSALITCSGHRCSTKVT